MKLRIMVDGAPREVEAGCSLAAVLARESFRRSISGQPRAAVCGMGVCFECRVTVDGQAHQRACQIVVREGMQVHRER